WTVTGPAISSLSPNTAVEGSAGFTLTVNGTGFQAGSTTVTFGGTNLTPNVLSSSQLTVNVPAALVLEDGAIPVTVTAPDGSGVPGRTVTSAPATFTVTKAGTLRVANADQNNVEGATVTV